MQLLSNKKYFPLVLLGLTILFVSVASYYVYDDWDIAWVDGIINAFVFTFCVWCASFITRKYPTHVAAIIFSSIIGICVGFTSWSLTSIALDVYFSRYPMLSVHTDFSSIARLLIHIVCACWVISLAAMKKKTEELEQKINNIADAVTLHKEAELYKLRQQLQPHFLYNSLNSINALILILPDKAQEMVGKLSDFLRASVKRETQTNIPLTEELEHIENYMAIESTRFGDRLNVEYEKQFDENATLPPFLLQPILENAIKFGLYGNTGIVVIKIVITQHDNMLLIAVENPVHETTQSPSGTGFGLEGIARRLYLLFGRTDLLETERTINSFITRLKIPQADVQSDINR